jgi:formamidopyrimidine-DNA glycosylase
MPELPELTVIQQVLQRRLSGQTIVSAQAIAPGGAIVVRDLSGAGFSAALSGARLDDEARRGKFTGLAFQAAGALVRPVVPWSFHGAAAAALRAGG